MLEMNNAMLNMVCGGNYDDQYKDTNPNKSWYEVGQEVEVFNSSFHYSTKRRTIKNKKYVDGCWKYYTTVIQYYCPIKGYITKEVDSWITASSIER